MRLWNINKLIAELREDSLSQKKKFYYFLTFFILFIWIGLVFQYIPVEVNFMLVLDNVIYLVLSFCGLVICFKTNQKGDNINFIERFICLSIPISIRLTVIICIIYIPYFLIGYIIDFEAFDRFTDKTNWVSILFTILFVSYFYGKLQKSIKSVSQVK